ncbi:MAG: glutamate racemase [Patescibacteria group bacterium]
MIGVFDSGVGGLTVLRELMKRLPGYSFVYFGDTARTPYGNKSPETIERYAREDAELLIREGAKLIVVACNTASALAGESLRKEFPVPIFDVIAPAVLRAAAETKSGKVGVIGTRATIGSGVYPERFRVSYPNVKVFSQACPLFVPLVEEGWLGKIETKQIIRRSLAPLRRENIDTLILGCTHYPLLASAIAQRIGRRVRLVDPAAEVAETVARYLGTYPEVASTLSRSGSVRILVSDQTPAFARLAERVVGKTLPIERVIL